MADAKASVAEKVAAHRKLRPDGTPYSSDRAERHAQLVEDGKLGAAGSELAKEHGKKGGRPRKVSAQELVAAKAREDAEEIYAALKKGLTSSSEKTRIDSAKAILEIEDKVIKRHDRQQREAQGLGKDEIIAMLVQKLVGKGPAANALKQRLAQAHVEIPDADVIDDDQPQLPA